MSFRKRAYHPCLLPAPCLMFPSLRNIDFVPFPPSYIYVSNFLVHICFSTFINHLFIPSTFIRQSLLARNCSRGRDPTVSRADVVLFAPRPPLSSPGVLQICLQSLSLIFPTFLSLLIARCYVFSLHVKTCTLALSSFKPQNVLVPWRHAVCLLIVHASCTFASWTSRTQTLPESVCWAPHHVGAHVFLLCPFIWAQRTLWGHRELSPQRLSAFGLALERVSAFHLWCRPLRASCALFL